MAPRRSTLRNTGDSSSMADLLSGLTAALTQANTKVINPFDGDDNVLIWLTDYEKACRARGWSETIMIRQISCFLSGWALTWFKTEDENSPMDRKPWDEIKQLMVSTFSHPINDLELRRKANRSQENQEDPLVYMEDKRNCCAKLMYNERDTIFAVISGLSEPYYSKMAGASISTIDRLRIKLRSLKIQEMSRKRGQSVGIAKPNEGPPKDARGIAKGQSDNRPLRFHCQKPGHIKKECWSLNGGGPGQTQGQAARGQRREAAAPYAKRYATQQPSRLLPVSEEAIDANKIDTVQSYPVPTLSIIINNVVVNAIVDTGACNTVLDNDLYWSKIADEHVQLSPSDNRLVGAGANGLENMGEVELTIQYHDAGGMPRSLALLCIVVNRLGSPMLLGMDFVSRVEAVLDIRKREISCQAPIGDDMTRTPIQLKFCTTSAGKTRRSGRRHRRTVKAGKMSADALTESHGASTTMIEGPPKEDIRREESEPARSHEVDIGRLAETANLEQQRDLEGFDRNLLTDTWGSSVPELSWPFADDPTEERSNPYVYQEKVKTVLLGEHLVNVGIELSDEEENLLIQVLKPNSHLFAFDGRLGDCTLIEHKIDTGTAKPINVAPYIRPHREREAVEKQIKLWLSQGLIKHSKSPWATRIVTVMKKDNSTRCCVDYRALNNVTEKDVYPLPTREEMMSHFDRMAYFSSIDLNQGYMQIRVNKEDQPKTAFKVQSGFYEFTRMPFGLTNAPATFQRLMDHILRDLKWQKCLVYLDDIIIFGRNLKEHNEHLGEVLHALAAANLTIKPSKCAFAVGELKFLGSVISAQGVKMDPEKIKAIVDAPTPTNVSEIRSLVGMASYYRCFVENFAAIVEPLTRLTRKEAIFEWGVEQATAHQILIKLLTSDPVMCHFDPRLPMELRTDASNYGLGAVLLQVFSEGPKRVISYASRLLDKAERNYGITEKECLAVVWAIEKHHMYLLGTKFTVVTDHLSLTWLKNKKDLSGRLMRWTNKLQPYHFDIVYKSGKHHKDADHLSRCMINTIAYGKRGTYKPSARHNSPTITYTEDDKLGEAPKLDLESFRAEQKKDNFCKQILEDGVKNPLFTMDNGLLVYIDESDARAERVFKPVVPLGLLQDILYVLHDDPTSGHCSYQKVLYKFRQRYYLRECATKIKAYTRTCHVCQTRKQPWTRRVGKLHPWTPVKSPFERIGIDTLGPFRRSPRGNEKVIVVTDYATRWAIAKAVPRENAEEIAAMLVKDVFLTYNKPQVILSDRGKSFRTALMRGIYKALEIKHVTTTAYHPQTNGLTERLNKTLAVMMSMYVNKCHDDWDECLPYAVAAYNQNKQDSTGYTPHYLLFGFESRLFTDLRDPNPELDLAGHFERLAEARDIAQKQTAKAQEQQKRSYDKNRFDHQFAEGDKVLVYRPRGQIGQTTKLRHPFEGPFVIVRDAGNLNYDVKDEEGKRPQDRVHVSRLKPYYTRDEFI